MIIIQKIYYHWKGNFSNYNSNTTKTILSLRHYLKWPDVPFWPGQYSFSICCPNVPKDFVGTPLCPVLLDNWNLFSIHGLCKTKCYHQPRPVASLLGQAGRPINQEGRQNFVVLSLSGRRWVIGISGSLIRSKTLMKLIFNPCGEFRWSSEGPVNQIHFPQPPRWGPWDLFRSLRSVQMLKREWGTESNRKLPHVFIPSKTAILVPSFEMKDLPLYRTATLITAFAIKDLSLVRTLWWWYLSRNKKYVKK